MNDTRFGPRPSNRYLPRLEVLEGRSCPAVNIAVLGGTMLILGDNAANTVGITDFGDGNVDASITSPTNTATRSAANINSIVVLARDGGDAVHYRLANALTTGRALLVDLGRGSDSANLDLSAGVDAAALLATVLGGDDADNLQARIGGIAAGAYAAVGLEGGRGGDTIDASSDGLLNGGLAVALAGGADNDTVSANLNIGAGSTGALVAAVLGGAGNDALTLNVNDDLADLSFLAAALDGGTGTDSCVATDNVQVTNCES
jgi:hypothetical protein